MRILLDLDGITVDMITPLLDRYNRLYGDNLTPEDITEWNLNPKLKTIFMTTPGFFRHLPFIRGAQEAIHELDLHYDLVFVTDASDNAQIAHDKILWKRDSIFSHIPMVIASNKNLIKGDLLIEDAPHHALEFDNKVILFDYPYNKCVPVTDTIKRVDNWQQALINIGYWEAQEWK